jgi:NodT family efflux transporter outer membrane factor (OMF) lipoprotein
MKLRAILYMLGVGLLTACNMAPKFKAPVVTLPDAYKEQNLTWVKAIDHLYNEKHSPWWHLFQDDTLNTLEMDLPKNNNDLRMAYLHYQNAKEESRITRSALYPNLNGIFNAARVRNSKSIASTTTDTKLYNAFLLTGLLTYEVDLWGKIRNSVRSSNQLAKASRYDLASLSLSIHAQLAQNYFLLRATDSITALLKRNMDAHQEVYRLESARFKEGLTDEQTYQYARYSLEKSKQLLSENLMQRAKLEHAIAILMGRMPSCFNIKVKNAELHQVHIQPKIPSTLMLSRPDIVASLHRLEAATANVGVALGAFFPNINVFLALGAQSGNISELFSSKSLYWSLGPSSGTTLLALVKPIVVAPIFDGFKMFALYDKSRLALAQSSVAYQDTVIVAFREVEDSLVAIRRVQEKLLAQKVAFLAVKKELLLLQKREAGGLSTYLDVAPVEVRYLQAKMDLIELKTQYQIETVGLIKALGGSGLPKFMH